MTNSKGQLNLHTKVLAAIFLAATAASQPAQNSEPTQVASPPVLLITVDTLRADRLGCYGAKRVKTPAMDRLAAQGIRFDPALAQVPITLPSHVVILSGTYPMTNGVRDFTSSGIPPSVGLISEAFERQGFATAAFVSAFVLDATWGFRRGFQVYDDHFDPRQFETENPGNIQRRGAETVDRLLTWLRGRPTGKPFFVWLHLYDPHSPYDPPEPFRHEYAGHLYDGEVAYTDTQLGRVFGYLRDQGIYDRMWIVLLSDHGESLGEHGEDEHGFFIYNSTLRVPLIFKPPQGAALPHVVEGPVGTIDVAPTLFDLLRFQDPLRRQFQGRSLASLVLGKGAAQARGVYSETYYPRDSFGWSALRSISTRRFHFILAPRPELYDVGADPAERRDLYAQRSAEAAALRDQLSDLERRYAGPAPSAAGPPLSAETLEKLKSLGYVAYSAPAAQGEDSSLPDPKDRLKVFKSILRATDLASAGRLDESNALLRIVAVQEPKLYLAPFLLGENAARARHWEEAQHQFLACLKLNPTFEQAIMGLARADLAEGKAQDARPWLELALHQNSHNFLAYYGLGLVARQEHRDEDARRYFQSAAHEKPNYAPAQQELGIVLVELRRYGEALGPLEQAAKFGPPNPVLANYLGTAYANTDQLGRAIQSYQTALSLKEDYAAARLNLAFAYLKSGERSRAGREFRTVCRQDEKLCQEFRSQFE
ncbi:MAG: sulfatase-like hydrolase/transferase [Acidobacteriia bacterium]|nr:sulfatase-like hydrolase/transferase [Terriglobia bacterium]